ncbi:helix-turn-helix transcriptional regulator [Sphingomonas sp. LT1P40]|uniref:helix-turn-helix transcriptional regulator n=1 Tax=Alteristakelama amylovorans TaxID=3096166 RepID=UPI002FCBCA59
MAASGWPISRIVPLAQDRHIANPSSIGDDRIKRNTATRSTFWWRQVAVYGVLLALGTALLQLLDYRWLARAHSTELYLLIVAGAFLALGLVIGARVLGSSPLARSARNPAAQATLGISEREMAVLREIAAGHSNKQIARNLGISPNTVKTHIARLFEKLGASRRTDALARARELGLIG